MKIAISGSSGLIGRQICDYFSREGHQISKIVRASSLRSDPSDKFIIWDTKKDLIEKEKLEGHDVIIHLAGANVGKGRWTKERMDLIRSSRIKGTSLIARTISELKERPKIFFSASSLGFYGNRGPEEIMYEYSSSGKGFLSEVVEQWEAQTKPASKVGIRVVHLRIGIVLASDGGVLGRMLPVFKLGFGGRLGSGSQIMSWIALKEIPMIIEHLIQRIELKGPVNLVSPNPVSNLEFSKTLGSVLRKPVIFHLPEFILKILFGKKAQGLLLSGSKVYPGKLEQTGYSFKYSELKQTLKEICCLE